MLMIDENTSRAVMLDAIYSTDELLDFFVNTDTDPEFMTDDEIRNTIIEWIKAGDETMGG